MVSVEPTRGLRTAVSWLAGDGRAVFGLMGASAGCVLPIQAAGAWMPSILARAPELSSGHAAIAIGGRRNTSGIMSGRYASTPADASI
jgi:hypothetical protein